MEIERFRKQVNLVKISCRRILPGYGIRGEDYAPRGTGKM